MSATGTWKITTTTPMGNIDSMLELKVEGASLTGSLIDKDGTRELTEGQAQADGKQLSWKAKVKKPFPMTLTFSATIDGDTITGGAKSAFGNAPFTGHRG